LSPFVSLSFTFVPLLSHPCLPFAPFCLS
jgi:hypothetical protein